MIRDAKRNDAHDIASIYNHYIANTVVTFEETSVEPDEMASRISETFDQGLPYLVAEDEDGRVIGYAYASKWKGRCAYRHSVEVTVYLHPNQGGQGLGTKLYTVLLMALKNTGYHVAIGGISLPNPASVALHEKFGMEKVGVFKEVGHKFDTWVDVGYWQGIISDCV